MEYGCYTVSKSDSGWTVCACGRAVLDCKQKRKALTAAMRAKQLMLGKAAVMDAPSPSAAAPGGCDACTGVQAER